MNLKYTTADIKGAGGGGFDAVISTPRTDLDGEVVVPTGLRNRDAYMANPLVYWAHEWAFDHAAEPIGKATRLDVFDDRIESSAVYAPTPKAQNIRALVQGGFVRKTSIGFDIEDGGIVEKSGTPHIVAWHLREYSVVPMPANTEATITGVKSALRWLAEEVAEPVEELSAGVIGATFTHDDIKRLVDACLAGNFHLTAEPSTSPLRGGEPRTALNLRDGNRVIASLRRRRVIS